MSDDVMQKFKQHGNYLKLNLESKRNEYHDVVKQLNEYAKYESGEEAFDYPMPAKQAAVAYRASIEKYLRKVKNYFI